MREHTTPARMQIESLCPLEIIKREFQPTRVFSTLLFSRSHALSVSLSFGWFIHSRSDVVPHSHLCAECSFICWLGSSRCCCCWERYLLGLSKECVMRENGQVLGISKNVLLAVVFVISWRLWGFDLHMTVKIAMECVAVCKVKTEMLCCAKLKFCVIDGTNFSNNIKT